MAAQPSTQNEDRHLLRRLAWEQRNQETSQAKESNHEIVPLFGEPYKTNGGDELSNRIQRMLGHYEDVNSPGPVAVVPLPVPASKTPSQSDRSDTNTDLRAKAPPLTEVQRAASQSQKGSSGVGHASQASPTATLASPDRHRSAWSSDAGQQQQLQVEPQSSLWERVDLLQGGSSRSPAASAAAAAAVALPPPPSCLQTAQQEVTEPRSVERHQPEGLKHFPPEDLPAAPANKVLPAQTFSSLLSKQPSVVMTQKPTAYVRPMDGQDQVVSESPELKPSPDSYTPRPESIIKTEPSKDKEALQYLEDETDEVLSVADILREMTCSWPPLLTAINSPCKAEPLKSLSPTKEVQHISSHPGQKEFFTSSADSSQHTHDNSSSSVLLAHSGGGDSPSSSDSGSSSRLESDGDSIADGQPPNPDSLSVKTEPDAPEPIQVDWQLGNWIRPSQHNSGIEGPRSSHPSPSPAHKQPGPLQTSTHTSVQVAAPKAHKRSQKCDKTSQDCHKRQSSQTAPSAGRSGCSKKHLSGAAKADGADAALAVKHGDAEVPKKDGHKAKTKTHSHKRNKEKGDDKRDASRSSKHKSRTKEKATAEPKALAALLGGCSSCGVQHPDPCACPTQPGQLPLSCRGETTCSKAKSACSSKSPHRTAQKHHTKSGHDTQRSQDAHRPPKSLTVKIDLSLLSRVPQNSVSHHQPQEAGSKAKRSKVKQQDPGGAGGKASASKNLTKSSRKTKTPHAEVDSTSLRKKPRLENGCSSPSRASAKRQVTAEEPEQKKAKKNHSQKDSEKCTGRKVRENSKAAHKKKESCKKSSGKLAEQPHSGKENPKSSSSSLKTKEPAANRPPLNSDDSGLHPVTHYIEEAKRLKHTADAEKDKCRKAFCYLEAAMYFVESGIAMENDTHTSRSSYTMFADTVDMLRFVLNNVLDASPTPSEKDSLKVLCLKCQSLLQMAMFHQKHKIALKYSKTLTSHFNNSGQKTPNPSVSTPRVPDTPPPLFSMPSPAITSSSGSGLPSDPSGGGGGSSVSFPLNIQQTAFSYVSITTLFLNAHDMWEQAEEVALRAGGMLKEVDTAVGPLSLTSSMVFMVRYIRQAVSRLRLRSQKGK